MKNQYRISKINNLYTKIILGAKKISPEYYINLRKSLILEKLTGMLTSEVNFESPDKSYYTFEYEDFKIIHTLLSSEKSIQNGIDYIYGMAPFFSEKDNKKIMITRLILKIGIDQYLYMSCDQKRNIHAEIIFFDESSDKGTVSMDKYENQFSNSINWKEVKNDEILIKLSPRPSKILNILEYLGNSINESLLELETPAENTNNNDNSIYSFKEFFKDTNKPITEDVPISVFTEPRPTIKCKDGFKLSVQASAYNSCYPKLTGLDIYKSYEVLSKKEIDEFTLYLSNNYYIGSSKITSKIKQYDFVPLNELENFIESHGGIDKEATMKLYEKNRPSELKRLSYAKKIMEQNLRKDIL